MCDSDPEPARAAVLHTSQDCNEDQMRKSPGNCEALSVWGGIIVSGASARVSRISWIQLQARFGLCQGLSVALGRLASWFEKTHSTYLYMWKTVKKETCSSHTNLRKESSAISPNRSVSCRPLQWWPAKQWLGEAERINGTND